MPDYDKRAMEIVGAMRNATNLRCILCFAAIITVGCTGRNTNPGLGPIRGRIDLEKVLSWFPIDTETLQVAKWPVVDVKFRVRTGRL